MSYLSYNFLLHWVNFHSSYHELSVQWQNDQGWLQFTITHYASYILNTRMDIRCSHPNYARGQKVKRANHLRNICYAQQLEEYGLLPGNRSIGQIGLSNGLTPSSQFNLLYWNGDYIIDNHTLELSFQLSNPMIPSHCQQLSNQFAYHGKRSDIIDKLVVYYHCYVSINRLPINIGKGNKFYDIFNNDSFTGYNCSDQLVNRLVNKKINSQLDSKADNQTASKLDSQLDNKTVGKINRRIDRTLYNECQQWILNDFYDSLEISINKIYNSLSIDNFSLLYLRWDGNYTGLDPIIAII
mmetsp:Transcript_25154/g.22882  ORF Transcript_25154/g.22882 Transcript_25154/m.22882 type:complete len:297 (+) Transcript_25154:599-1489(+)